MAQNKYDIFISYSRKDIDEVKAFLHMLTRRIPDLTYWFDITGIESGDEFEDKIIAAIEDSSYVLFAISDNSLESQYTKDEVMYAKNTGKKVIPVLLKGAKLKKWFLFKFGRVDHIDSTNPILVDKLINNLSDWTNKKIVSSDSIEDTTKRNEEARHKAEEEERRNRLLNILDDDIIYYEDNGKYGFKVKSTGEVITPSKYDNTGDYFHEGLARVKLDDKWGYIDKSGKEIIPLKYDLAVDFHEGLACVELNDKYGYIDKSGKEVIPLKYDDTWFFSEGLAKVKLNGKYGYIDKTGKEIIPLKYDYANDFYEGMAYVELNGEEFRIDKEGNRITEHAKVTIHANIHRNDPCPCGSGKKYKNCHG